MSHVLRLFLCGLVMLLGTAVSLAQDAATEALRPVDTSSPRATMKSFLSASDEVTEAYLIWKKDPNPENRDAVKRAVHRMTQTLDLSELPQAAREDAAPETALLLWEVLARLRLPAASHIPGIEDYKDAVDAEGNPKVASWQLPNTEIYIRRLINPDSEQDGQFLFAPRTVAGADRFFNKVKDLPYRRNMKVKDPIGIYLEGTGSLVPPIMVEGFPEWLKQPYFNQVLWKWFAVLGLLGLAGIFILLLQAWVFRWRGQRRLARIFQRFLVPLVTIICMIWISSLAHEYIRTTGMGSVVTRYVTLSLGLLAGAWAAWLLANSVGEAILLFPGFHTGSVDAHLIRLVVRVFGIIVAATILLYGASIMGVPINGLIAGVSIGSLAIALAAQSTLENFVGSLSLYADAPIKAGDFFQYGTEKGIVEEIGLRSTRIRGLDRTVQTVPNSLLSKMTLINYTRRDRILLRHSFGLRYETTSDQLRYVLNGIRELLIAHPRVADEPTRVRFTALNDYSLDVEMFAYILTTDYTEYLAVQEDILLRLLSLLEEAGVFFALPSQTTYLARDRKPSAGHLEAAEQTVEKWRNEGDLPFPEMDEARIRDIRNTADYPPKGSLQNKPAS